MMLFPDVGVAQSVQQIFEILFKSIQTKVSYEVMIYYRSYTHNLSSCES